MVGIGKYYNSQDIDGVDIDYKNVQKTFLTHFRYDIHFENSMQYSNDYKLDWTKGDIKKFLRNVQYSISTEDYDGLIFIISGDGETDNDWEDCIVDSNGKEHKLKWFFEQFYSSQCPKLKDKPKIFIVDCCRGRLLPNKNTQRVLIEKMEAKPSYQQKVDMNSKELIVRIYSTSFGDAA